MRALGWDGMGGVGKWFGGEESEAPDVTTFTIYLCGSFFGFAVICKHLWVGCREPRGPEEVGLRGWRLLVSGQWVEAFRWCF